MHADALPNTIAPHDRLVTTVCFALLLHGLLIFGVAFTATDPFGGRGEQTLEITLVNAPSQDPPDKADYLAEAAQSGTGNTAERTRARSPDARLGNPEAAATRGTGAAPRPGEHDDRAADGRPRAAAVPDPLLAARRDGHQRLTVALRAGAGSAAAAAYGAALLLPSIPADIEAHTAVAYTEQPRERVVSVNTEEALYAAYLDSWRNRIEHIGNLNYPDEARRQGLTGALTLEVAIGSSGTVRQLFVRRGSGHRVLDDAAMRIVYMATPFPPFPADLRREVDILRFAFVWEFGDGPAGASVRAARPRP